MTLSGQSLKTLWQASQSQRATLHPLYRASARQRQPAQRQPEPASRQAASDSQPDSQRQPYRASQRHRGQPEPASQTASDSDSQPATEASPTGPDRKPAAPDLTPERERQPENENNLSGRIRPTG